MNEPNPNVVKLAAMECAASCLLTYLKMKNISSRYFLINYWSLNYSSNLLMSGKNIRLYRLDYFYGIHQQLKKGTEKELMALLNNGSAALLMCKAADLDYFPRELLTHEENGIQHFALIYGYDRHSQQFLVADPTADYSGELSVEQMRSIGHKGKGDSLYYYSLEPTAQFSVPAPKDAMRMATKLNLQLYTKGDHNFGYRAVERFLEDLVRSSSWSKDRRDQWIYQNNITISSIVKTRIAVWNGYCDLELLTAPQLEEGNAAMDALVKLWTTINFLLIKYKKKFTDTTLLHTLTDKLSEIKQREKQFLIKLEQMGCERCEV